MLEVSVPTGIWGITEYPYREAVSQTAKRLQKIYHYEALRVARS